jgi:hypothetical protein
MDEYNCDICKDSKHVFVGGVWKKCECLNTYLSTLNYSSAGITYPPEKLKLTLEDIQKEWPSCYINASTFKYFKAIELAVTTNNIIPNKLFCFQGTPITPKDFMIQCILKQFVDRGRKVKHVAMTELIEQYFRDKTTFSLGDTFLQHEVFSLYFGVEIQAKVSCAFLQELIRMHQNNAGKHCLMLNTSLPFDMIGSKYGDSFKSLFIRDTGISIDPTEKRVIYMGVTN